MTVGAPLQLVATQKRKTLKHTTMNQHPASDNRSWLNRNNNRVVPGPGLRPAAGPRPLVHAQRAFSGGLRRYALLGVLLFPGWASAEVRLLHSFASETKIKGRLAPLHGFLYGVADKGGIANAGYIGRLDPMTGLWEPVYEFSGETKVRGGLTVAEEALWFVCEKGGAHNYGYLGQFRPSDGALTVWVSFSQDLKPKTAPMRLDDGGWWFLTEKGGTANAGALMQYHPDSGLTALVSFHSATGVKFEAPPLLQRGLLWYAAREGGDLTQMSGKGAGVLGAVDPSRGEVIPRLALQAALHGAKIRDLVWFRDKLYYAAEEGGDLSLNAGKGHGGIGMYDPDRNTARLLYVGHPDTGIKPRALAVAGSSLYFLCQEGGPSGYGTLARLDHESVTIVAAFDAETGAKAEALTVWNHRIYLTTELGAAFWQGGIAAYTLPPAALPVLGWHVTRSRLHLRLPEPGPWVLETAPDLSGPWRPTPVEGSGSSLIEIPLTDPIRFFRLRPLQP